MGNQNQSQERRNKFPRKITGCLFETVKLSSGLDKELKKPKLLEVIVVKAQV